MKLKCKLILIIFTFFLFNFVYSAGMDPIYKYAWGENIGWVNFNPINGNVNVSDTNITGFVWSENYGWINLSPTNGGVFNDGNGNLSGYAWGKNLGWIDFSHVKIKPDTGEFSGYAVILKDNSKINFDCANCKVKTEWRKETRFLNAPLYSGHEEKKEYNISEDLIKTLVNLFLPHKEEKKEEIEKEKIVSYQSFSISLGQEINKNYVTRTEENTKEVIKTSSSSKLSTPYFFVLSTYGPLLVFILLIFLIVLGILKLKK